MEKKGLILLIILLSVQGLFAQDDYIFNGSILQDYKLLSNPSVQSPDVAAFQKVTQIPVSNYTGRANISIPIYNIQVGSMNVPIEITYNTSGVKVADMPSNVGSNWTLNAGGVVTRSVQGLDDFTIPKDIITQGSNEKTPGGWLISLMNYPKSSNQQNDPMPDIYHVNAPGLSTKYIHKKVINNVATPVEIENNGNKIEETLGEVYSGSVTIPGNPTPFSLPTFGPTSLKITSINGIQYNFATPEVSYNQRNGVSINNIFDAFSFKANAFKLDSMYDPKTNQTIDFVYEEYSNNFHDVFYAQPGIYSYSSNIVSNRLTHINFDKGSVEFIYGLDRVDNIGEKALTEVLIKNHIGTIVKHMKFEYGYFQSTINPTTPQSKRLRLEKVYQVNGAGSALVGDYTFTYNTNINMPPRDSWAHDFLGYNNGSYLASNTFPVPKIYKSDIAYNNNYTHDTTSNNNYRRVYTPFDNGTQPVSDALNNSGNFSLEADETASKAYILTKIKYPTGGTSEIEYESNEFIYGTTKKGGGLRVKSLKIIDEFGIEQVQDYSYYNGYISQLPSYTTLDKYGLRLFNVPQSNIELTDGSFVGYGHVNIINRYDKQITSYSYYNASDYPNTPSAKTVFGNDVFISRAWRASARYSLYLDRDILRGKLHKKEVIDRNGQYVLKQEYEYLLKEFSTINYTFQNPIYDPNRQGCYDDNGLYYRFCGGYDEEIDFPIERNLLIIIKNKILEDFHGESINTQGVYGEYVETEKRYQYDSELPRMLSEAQGRFFNDYIDIHVFDDLIAQCNGDLQCEEEIRLEFSSQNPYSEYTIKKYTYPSSTSPLYSQHRLTTPEFISFGNESSEILKSEDYFYKDFGNNIIDLEKVDYLPNYRFPDLTPKPSDIIKKRDGKGNILEIISPSGVYTSFVYGYGSRYLICKLNNVSYTELTSAAATLNISLNELTNTNSETKIKSETNQLRLLLTEGQIESYTYAPLVGVTNVISVRGTETKYEYDDYNRLEYIRDNNQNIISKNSYNYKN